MKSQSVCLPVDQLLGFSLFFRRFKFLTGDLLLLLPLLLARSLSQRRSIDLCLATEEEEEDEREAEAAAAAAAAVRSSKLKDCEVGKMEGSLRSMYVGRKAITNCVGFPKQRGRGKRNQRA